MVRAVCFILLLTAYFSWAGPGEDIIRAKDCNVQNKGGRGDLLLRFYADMNHDGFKEKFEGRAGHTDGHRGVVWDVWKGGRAGYEYIGNIAFYPNSFYIGYIKQIGKDGLVAFYPEGAGEGSFFGFTIKGKEIVTTELESIGIHATPEARDAFMKKYHGDELPFPPVKIQRIPIPSLMN
jgi:hypothetical protein